LGALHTRGVVASDVPCRNRATRDFDSRRARRSDGRSGR
jgi:hypothetical protein